MLYLTKICDYKQKIVTWCMPFSLFNIDDNLAAVGVPVGSVLRHAMCAILCSVHGLPVACWDSWPVQEEPKANRQGGPAAERGWGKAPPDKKLGMVADSSCLVIVVIRNTVWHQGCKSAGWLPCQAAPAWFRQPIPNWHSQTLFLNYFQSRLVAPKSGQTRQAN